MAISDVGPAPSVASAQERGERSAEDDDPDRAAREERFRERRERFREGRERFRREGRGSGEGEGRRFGRGRGGEGRPSREPDERGGAEGELNDASSSRNESSQANRPSAESSGGGMDIRAYARALIEEHDKDGDMMLRGEELAGLGRLATQADLNGDGVVTLDELVTHLSSQSQSAASGGATATGGGAAGTSTGSAAAGSIAVEQSSEESIRPRRPFGRGDRDESRRDRGRSSANGSDEAASPRVLTNGDRPSHRFTPAKERLPGGLPSFFSRDANGDGQISMHEFATVWTERTVEEFRRYDLNNDGVITPEEALQVLQGN